MIKRRIASMLIVLLVALGVTFSGSFPSHAGKENTAKENTEEVTAGVRWHLTFYERKDLRNTAYKVRQLWEDSELLNRLEAVKEAGQETAVILDTPWAQAYCEFLEEKLKEKQFLNDSAGFRLVYIDDDDVPELLIMEDDFHGAGVSVCTYYHNKVVEIGEFGSMGNMFYAERQGKIRGGFTNFGESFTSYYVLDHGKAEVVGNFHTYPDLDYEDYSVTLYEIDGEPVTEKQYNEKLDEFERDNYESVGYNDAVLVDDPVQIKTMLAQEIENLELKSSLTPEENPFFYSGRNTILSADIQYDAPETWDTVSGELEIKWLKRYDNGDLYKLSVEGIPEGFLGPERKNIYLYVTPDEIYRLWSYYRDEDGQSITFYNNDSLLMETFDTDEKLIENGELVCCMEKVEDEPGKEDLGENEMGTPISEIGKHITIVPEGEQITYSRWDVKPNGERDFYENFVWERGKGLVGYRSGFRAEAEILYIENISIKD